MKALTMVLLSSVFFTALLSPSIYAGILTVWPEMHWPFSRVLDRVILVVLAVHLYLARRRLPVSAALRAFKRGNWSMRITSFLFAFGAAVIACAVVIPVLVNAGVLISQGRPLDQMLFKGLRATFAGVAVSIIEEGFFRVLLLNFLMQPLGLAGAIIGSSLLYSVVHFLAPVKTFELGSDLLFGGFHYLSIVVARVADPTLLPALLGLFAAGVVLCLVMVRTKNVYYCLGIHSAWVVVLKLVAFGTTFPPEHPLLETVGRRYLLIADPLGWGAVLLVPFSLYLAISLQKRFFPAHFLLPLRLLFASNNKGKLEEVRAVAREFPGIEVVGPGDLNLVSPPNPHESADTYVENARIKAQAFLEWSNIAAFADDSGLEVDALSGKPGVLSARFAGPQAKDSENIDLLLTTLSAADSRDARFVSVIVLRFPDGTEFTAQGEIKGEILESPELGAGFGYDPIFRPQGYDRSLARLKEQGVKVNTHRINALRDLFGEVNRDS